MFEKLLGKKETVKLTDDEKDLKVLTEVTEAQKCTDRNDASCTVKHLTEARKYEDCGACKRQMTRTIKDAPYLPKEKLVRKVQLIKEYVEPAGTLHKKYVEMNSIRPSRKAVIAGKTKSVLRSTGRGIKSSMSWVKRRFTKPKEAKP